MLVLYCSPGEAFFFLIHAFQRKEIMYIETITKTVFIQYMT